MSMFDKLVVKTVNCTLAFIGRLTKRKFPIFMPDALARYDIQTTISIVPRAIDKTFDAINEEIQKSRGSALTKKSLKTILSRLPALPLLANTKFLNKADVCRLTSPFIFIVAFIAFLGMSDHGISSFALFSIVMALVAYAIGTVVAKLHMRSIPEKAAPYLLASLIILVLGIIPFGDISAKISIIPLVILIFSRTYGGKISLAAALGGYVLFRQGMLTLGMPYLLIGILGSAHNFRSTRFDALLEDNATLIAFLLMGIGTLYWVFDIALVGRIPLLTTREGLDPTFTMRSHLLPIGTILLVSLLGEYAKKTGSIGKARMLTLISVTFSVILMALLGYRTQVLITLVASMIVVILWELVTVAELFAITSVAVGFFAIMTFLRTETTGAHVGILESISIRTGLTLDIYDTMAQLGGYLGFTKGQTYMAAIRSFATLMPGIAFSPRRYIAIFAGAGGISMTSTILGPIALDFGLVGTIVAMVALGFFLQRSYMLVKAASGTRKSYMTALYGLTLGYALIGIETGLVDYEVLLLFACSFLYTLHISTISQG